MFKKPIEKKQYARNDFAPADLHLQRGDICGACPNNQYDPNTDDFFCKLCGCYIIDRSAWTNNHCPINKW